MGIRTPVCAVRGHGANSEDIAGLARRSLPREAVLGL